MKPTQEQTPLPDCNGRELFLWLLRRRQRYRVEGPSMQPLLATGDEVLVDPRAYAGQAPHTGDLIVARHPQQPGLHIIKRVTAASSADEYLLHGDNPDPEQNSPCRVSTQQVVGRVTSRFA